jgi:hypothetical protein
LTTFESYLMRGIIRPDFIQFPGNMLTIILTDILGMLRYCVTCLKIEYPIYMIFINLLPAVRKVCCSLYNDRLVNVFIKK